MQCSVCEKTFAIELSVCPSCGSMPSQHSPTEASLRFLSIEKIKTSELELEIDDEKEAVAAVSTELIRPKHEYRSTLIEFPARRQKNPEWRDEIKNRVRLSQERRRGELSENIRESAPEKTMPAPKSNLEGSSSPNASQSAEPALIIDLVPNIKENRASEKIVARALERIERSRQNFDGAPSEQLTTFGSKINSASSTTTTAPEPQMAEVSVKNESRTIDSRLSLVNSKGSTAAAATTTAPAPPRTRRVLPSIDDDSFDDLSIEPSAAPESIVSVKTENIPPHSFNVSIENKSPGEKTAFDDLEDNESIEASLRSVRKTTVLEQTLAEQQPAARISAARQQSDDYAPLLKRAGAGAVDALLCAVLTAGLLALLGFARIAADNLTTFLTVAGVFALVNFLYFIPALMFTGTTLGLKIFRLQVVAVEDGMVPTLAQTILNVALYLLSLSIFGIGFLTVFFSSEKRTLHDLIAGTVVVRDEG